MIPQHGHCNICGKAIKFGEAICSEKCQKEYEQFVKKRKMYVYIMYGAVAVLLVVVFLQILG